MKLRKSAMAAIVALALLAACGSDDPTGDVDSGTGNNVATTADDPYN